MCIFYQHTVTITHTVIISPHGSAKKHQHRIQIAFALCGPGLLWRNLTKSDAGSWLRHYIRSCLILAAYWPWLSVTKMLPNWIWHVYQDAIWVVLRNCVPLGVGNFKLVFEGNLLLQCKYFYFLSLYVDVSDNKNSNDCQSCVLCTLNRTDVAKWIKNGATDLWHRQHHWKECIRNFIKTTQWQRI